VTKREQDAKGWLDPMDEAGRAAFATYLELVGKWNRAVDLVGRRAEDTALPILVEDALAALEYLPEAGRILDIGSGVGVPAIPILLARTVLNGTLLEPRERRWAFLREVVRELGCDARMLVLRERLEQHRCSGYDAVLVRGLSRAVWWSGALSRLAKNGTVLWWTSNEQAVEAQEELGAERVVTSRLPGSRRGRLVVWRQCST
jgi:16S rRNA (guanine(527)-N(7))-methyltransferase RsmG